MSEIVKIWLSDAEKTIFSGESLSRSLYVIPVTMLLRGALGVGKTTFLQGFCKGLGVTDPVRSPTFSIQCVYVTAQGGTIDHLDLYRLPSAEATIIFDELPSPHSIRCIEWFDRVGIRHPPFPWIDIFLSDAQEQSGRSLCVTFGDISLPSDEEIDQWRRDVMLPYFVVDHCEVVAAFAERLASFLSLEGTLLRSCALKAACRLHDLLRFLDFREGAGPSDFCPSLTERSCWSALASLYSGMTHEAACASFLCERGYLAIARIVATHGIRFPPQDDATIEQLLLFYADKRVVGKRIVSLEERFEDFRQRYGSHDKRAVWLTEARFIESQLFPRGCPF